MTDAATVHDHEMTTAGAGDAGAGDSDSGSGTGGGLVRRLGPILKIGATLVILVAIGWFLVSHWGEVTRAWSQLTWVTVLLAVLAAFGGLAASSAGWRDAAADIGNPVTFAAAVRIFVIGQLGKYVPGSVWAFVLQTELGRRAGIPRARAFLASMIAMGVGITAALVVGVAGVPTLINPPDSDSDAAAAVRVGLIVMLALCPVALICMVPKVLTYLVGTALRLMRREPLAAPLTWSGVLRVFGWNIVAWLCYGVHFWLLVDANADPGLAGYVRCVGAFAIAMTVGMFWPAPSGIGVREAILVAALAPFLTGDDTTNVALGIAFASRLIFLIAEVAGAALAALTDLDGTRRLLRPGGRTD